MTDTQVRAARKWDRANTARRDESARRVVPAIKRALAEHAKPGARQVPEEMVTAARLRVEHPDASLSEIGEMFTPRVSKDAVAGRLRRFIGFFDPQAGSDD